MTTMSPLARPLADDDAIGLVARDSRLASGDTVPVAGSTTQTAGLPALSNSALPGSTTTGAVDAFRRPTTLHAEAHLRRRVLQRDLDLVGARRRIGDRRDLAHHALGRDAGIAQQRDDDLGLLVGRCRLAKADSAMAKTASFSSGSRQPHDHLADIDDLARPRRRRP